MSTKQQRTVVSIAIVAFLLFTAVGVWYTTRPALPNTDAIRAAIESMETTGEPLTLDAIKSRVNQLDGWSKVVVCSPYRVESEFADAGIDNPALAENLTWHSNARETWHVIAIDADDDIIVAVSIRLDTTAKPTGSVFVITRK